MAPPKPFVASVPLLLVKRLSRTTTVLVRKVRVQMAPPPRAAEFLLNVLSLMSASSAIKTAPPQ
jgi:hypothetical protein